MMSGTSISGKILCGRIVKGGAPGMSKLISALTPEELFARIMADLSEPGPESFVFVTVNTWLLWVVNTAGVTDLVRRTKRSLSPTEFNLIGSTSTGELSAFIT